MSVCVYIYRQRERGRTVVGALGSSRCRSRMSNYLRMITPSFIHSFSVFVLYTCHHLVTSMLIPTEDHSHWIYFFLVETAIGFGCRFWRVTFTKWYKVPCLWHIVFTQKPNHNKFVLAVKLSSSRIFCAKKVFACGPHQ